MSDALLQFYRGHAPDSEGRMFELILATDDEWLEHQHDYIQWLFPLTGPSRFNPDAPILTAADICAFHADPSLRANLRKAFERMLSFYGFRINEVTSPLTIVPAPNWAARSPQWLTPHNHNFLRITRILTALRTLGLEREANAFFEALRQVYESAARDTIGATTFSFWRNAARSNGPA